MQEPPADGGAFTEARNHLEGEGAVNIKKHQTLTFGFLQNMVSSNLANRTPSQRHPGIVLSITNHLPFLILPCLSECTWQYGAF